MRKSKGYQANTRALFRLNPRERGKTTLGKVLYDFKEGERVLVKINPSVHKGMPHRRFHGKIGVVATKRGRSYVVDVAIGNSTKEIVVRPEHLSPYASAVGS